ncbi:hypothetical protein PENSPDRAFT_278183 [Peniophora sp. CONT]|nr:hypothetical protein PENSPDRAFT_278183 [Peniophora sp. CONT]
MPPYTITPPYPSFSLVISEAYLHVRSPEPRADLPLPSRFHPYTRPVPRERYLDECMVSVDYRYTPPPVPAVSFSPGSEDIMAIDFNDRDDASVESYFFALNNLDDAVHSENLNKVQKLRELGRRPSLSTLVIDLALLVKEKLKKLKPAGSGASRATQSQK